MFEIDVVRTAIEHHPPYDEVDKISDTYLHVIDLATRPRLDERRMASLHQQRAFLQAESEFTRRILGQYEDMCHMAYARSVTEAYDSVLAQVDVIMDSMLATV